MSNVPAEKAPQISVVVPVYKVEQFVGECIESILAQTFTDFELLLVDDGSPDNSGKICDEYAARDSRIRVFHKPNGGVSAARNLGVQNARGEWICFVDSDDVLLPHALEVLFAETKNFPAADVVSGESFNFRTQSEYRELAAKPVRASTPHIAASGIEYARDIASRRGFFVSGPGQKIIRRTVLLQTGALNVPAEIVYAEDHIMNLVSAVAVRSAVCIPVPVYARRETRIGILRYHRNYAIYTTPEYRALWWNTEYQMYGNRSDEWNTVWKLSVASAFCGSFFRTPGKFLKHPEIQPFLSVVSAPELAQLHYGGKRRTRLILLGTKFPLSLLPEPVFRALLSWPRLYRLAVFLFRIPMKAKFKVAGTKKELTE